MSHTAGPGQQSPQHADTAPSVTAPTPPDVGPVGLVAPLRSLSRDDAATAGTKAATLGALAQAGIAVPEGLVLTAAAAHIAVSALGSAVTAQQVLHAPLPDVVEAALVDIAEHFGDAVLAVRSSAVAEDLPDASYAGQYDSVLGVQHLAALRDAVRRCWASAYDERVRTYSGGDAPPPAIAVLVQRQVGADIAGVAFSANPVSGATDEVLVSAMPGLADALVGGTVQPDEWTVRGATATAVRVSHQALTAQQAQSVAALALRVHAVLDVPVDVEWVMVDGRLLLVQARPITVLPVQPDTCFPPGTWLKDTEHYPEPFTTFGASLAVPWVAEELSSMLASWGGVLARMDLRSIGGEVYLRPVPLGGREGPPPPWWLLGVLSRLAPPLRRRMRTARTMMRPEVFIDLAEKWQAIWQPQLQSAAERLHAVDLTALDDTALDTHLGEVLECLHTALHHHFHLIPLYTVPAHDLVQVCRDLLGWDEAEALGLLAGVSAKSSEPARAMAELAARISQVPAARAVAESGSSDVADRLAEADADLGAAYAQWCRGYALRCINDDPGSPVYAERPALLASLLRDAVRAHTSGDAGLAHRTEAARTEATQRARATLAGHPASDRSRFEDALETALRYYPLREDTTFWLAQIAGAGRLCVVDAGRRLAGRGILDRAGDAIHVDVDTLRAALTGTAATDLRGRVRRAKAERAWVRLHPGPAVVGPPPGAPPDLRALPKHARRLNTALSWSQPRPPTPRPDPDTVATGVAASPGCHTGPVRVVHGEADFASLRPGDVLVSATTDPGWSVLFGIAGALVTDVGSVLSHAAIIAREHALPAVVGTSAATSTLHDGEIVTVDGTTGRVLRHANEPPPTPSSPRSTPTQSATDKENS